MAGQTCRMIPLGHPNLILQSQSQGEMFLHAYFCNFYSQKKMHIFNVIWPQTPQSISEIILYFLNYPSLLWMSYGVLALSYYIFPFLFFITHVFGKKICKIIDPVTNLQFFVHFTFTRDAHRRSPVQNFYSRSLTPHILFNGPSIPSYFL